MNDTERKYKNISFINSSNTNELKNKIPKPKLAFNILPKEFDFRENLNRQKLIRKEKEKPILNQIKENNNESEDDLLKSNAYNNTLFKSKKKYFIDILSNKTSISNNNVEHSKFQNQTLKDNSHNDFNSNEINKNNINSNNKDNFKSSYVNMNNNFDDNESDSNDNILLKNMKTVSKYLNDENQYSNIDHSKFNININNFSIINEVRVSNSKKINKENHYKSNKNENISTIVFPNIFNKNTNTNFNTRKSNVMMNKSSKFYKDDENIIKCIDASNNSITSENYKESESSDDSIVEMQNIGCLIEDIDKKTIKKMVFICVISEIVKEILINEEIIKVIVKESLYLYDLKHLIIRTYESKNKGILQMLYERIISWKKFCKHDINTIDNQLILPYANDEKKNIIKSNEINDSKSDKIFLENLISINTFSLNKSDKNSLKDVQVNKVKENIENKFSYFTDYTLNHNHDLNNKLTLFKLFNYSQILDENILKYIVFECSKLCKIYQNYYLFNINKKDVLTQEYGMFSINNVFIKAKNEKEFVICIDFPHISINIDSFKSKEILRKKLNKTYIELSHSKNLENSFLHFTNKSLIKSIVNKTLNDGILNYSESKNEFTHKSTKEILNTNLFAYNRILDYYDIGIIILLSTVSVYLKECQYNIFYNYISNYSCNHNINQNNPDCCCLYHCLKNELTCSTNFNTNKNRIYLKLMIDNIDLINSKSLEDFLCFSLSFHKHMKSHLENSCKNFENFIDINKNNAFVLKLLKYDSIDNSNYSSNKKDKQNEKMISFIIKLYYEESFINDYYKLRFIADNKSDSFLSTLNPLENIMLSYINISKAEYNSDFLLQSENNKKYQNFLKKITSKVNKSRMKQQIFDIKSKLKIDMDSIFVFANVMKQSYNDILSNLKDIVNNIT